MEITRNVPVTIEVTDDGSRCSRDCFFAGEEKGCRWCNRYGVDLFESQGRASECVAEFGVEPNSRREYVIDDDQLWAAMLGMQAAICECNDEWQGMEDPEPSQADENWFASRLGELIALREIKE